MRLILLAANRCAGQLSRRNWMLRRSLTTSATSPATTTNSNSSGEVLKKIDLEKEMKNFTPVQQLYIQRMIAQNKERYERARRLKSHQRIAAVTLFTFILSVYFYTMFSIRQEKFLDDFEVPVPPDAAAKNYIEQAENNPKRH